MIHLGMGRCITRDIDEDGSDIWTWDSKKADDHIPITGNGPDVNHGHSLLFEVFEDTGR